MSVADGSGFEFDNFHFKLADIGIAEARTITEVGLKTPRNSSLMFYDNGEVRLIDANKRAMARSTLTNVLLAEGVLAMPNLLGDGSTEVEVSNGGIAVILEMTLLCIGQSTEPDIQD